MELPYKCLACIILFSLVSIIFNLFLSKNTNISLLSMVSIIYFPHLPNFDLMNSNNLVIQSIYRIQTIKTARQDLHNYLTFSPFQIYPFPVISTPGVCLQGKYFNTWGYLTLTTRGKITFHRLFQELLNQY